MSQAAQHDPGQESFVRTPDGLSLSVREWGKPDGPEILLIHGQAQCYLSFSRQTGSALAAKFRLVTFDLRGHGRSDKPLQPHYYQGSQAWADDVAAVIEAKQLRRPVLVGWSMGGRVIRNYLMHRGDARLSGINFLASRPIEDPGNVGPGSLAMRGSAEFDFAARLRAEIGFLRDCFAKPLEGDDLLLAVAYNMLVPPPVRDAIAAWSTDPALATEALAQGPRPDADHAWPPGPADPARGGRDDRGGGDGITRVLVRRLRPLAILRGRAPLQPRARCVRHGVLAARLSQGPSAFRNRSRR